MAYFLTALISLAAGFIGGVVGASRTLAVYHKLETSITAEVSKLVKDVLAELKKV